MIRDVGLGDPTSAAKAMQRLTRRYWPAVYAYVRRSGHDVHEAADLTQGFICDVMLSRQLVQNADPGRGRFRSLLLAALKNYLRQQHRRGTARRRGGKLPREIDLDRAAETVADYRSDDSPDAAFAAQYGATLVRQVLDLVRADCLEDGQQAHWAVFERRVARPLLLGETPESYATLIEHLGLPSAAQAANMLVTVKRRFARTLINEVARTVSDPVEVEAELNDLLKHVERRR